MNTKPSITQLKEASIGSPITRAGVTLFPVYIHQPPTKVQSGVDRAVEVSECPSAHVPSLRVTNPFDAPVLIAEGETVVGGRQNRCSNVSVLVPGCSTIEIPVSCTEAGRWGGGEKFSGRGPKAPRRVRREVSDFVTKSLMSNGGRFSDQTAVWEEIDRELAAGGVQSNTRAVQHLMSRADHESDLAEALDDLRRRGPLPGQCGVVVTHGRRVVGADIYGDAELFRASWEMVVGGYLCEARLSPEGRPSVTKALRFLTTMASGVVSVVPGVGLGEELRVDSSKVAGQALVFGESLIHASAFALAA